MLVANGAQIQATALPEYLLRPLWRGQPLGHRSNGKASNLSLPGRPRVVRPVAKLWFFLRREGISLTLRKIRATQRMREAAKAMQLQLVIGQRCEHDDLWLAVGRQWNKDPGPLRVPAEHARPLVASALDGRVPQSLSDSELQRIGTWISDQLEQLIPATEWEMIANYSVFSGKPGSVLLGSTLERLASSIDSPAPLQTDTAARKDGVDSSRVGTKPRNHQTAGRGCYDLVLIGGGAYPQCYVLPALGSARRSLLIEQDAGVRDAVSREFKFAANCARLEEAEEWLRSLSSPVAVVSSYHANHIEHALQLRTWIPDMPLFIEKPPVVKPTDLPALEDLLASGGVSIGYNRPHAPLINCAQQLLALESGPLTLTMDVKEVPLLPEHWYYWPNQGSRLAANLCHWIDLALVLTDSEIVSVHPVGSRNENQFDSAAVVANFADGSLLTIVASPTGDSVRGVQEQICIRRGELSLQIDDFCALRWSRNGRSAVRRFWYRDKGHAAMYQAFDQQLRRKQVPCISPERGKQIVQGSAVCFEIVNALKAELPPEHRTTTELGNNQLAAEI